jgi:type IV secretion system protein VirD4
MREPVDFQKNIITASRLNHGILPNGETFSLDGIQTRLNNNMAVIGTSGSSKTRSVVIPNLLSVSGSYVVSDPKGTLYKRYKSYFKDRGYRVVHIDFIHPENSDGYNPFIGADTPDKIMKIAHYLTYADKNPDSTADPFWDKTSELLLSALIGYMADLEMPANLRTVDTLARLIDKIDPAAIDEGEKCALDHMFVLLESKYKKNHGCTPWSYLQYKKFLQTPRKTLSCIITTIQSNIGSLDTPEINAMMSAPQINFTEIGTKKTAVFIEVSDTDRSKDVLVNTFYTQAMNALCTYADEKCKNFKLPVPVRFILDDFGTNCKIEGFENMISNIRSRNISAMIVLQSVYQLENGYGASSHTILDNCDTLIYMGGNDIGTAETISKRANKPLCDILNMPVGTNWVFRRGQKPKYSRTVDIDEYKGRPSMELRLDLIESFSDFEPFDDVVAF